MPANTISQRISIEGALDVIRQLKDMGAAGEAAIRQIQDAVGASAGTTSTIGNFADRVREQFKAIREHVEPIKEQFHELHNAASEFGNKVKEVGDNIFPHFREIAALATAGAVIGFVEMIKHAAEYTQELKRTADEVGLNVEEYQKLQFVVRSVGLDQERFISTFTRLARSVGQALQEERAKLLDYTQKLFGDLQTGGVQIVGETEERLKEQSSRLKSVVGSNSKEVIDAARRMYDALKEAATRSGTTFTIGFEQIKQRIVEIASDPSLQGAKDRIDIFKNLGVALPAQRVSETIERIKSAGKDLDQLFRQLGVPLKDLSGNVRSMTLIMEDAAKALDHVREGEKQFDAQLIFNRGFKEVLPLFSHGGEEIHRLGEEFEKMNVAMSETEIEAGSRLFGAIAGLNITLENMKTKLILVFGPDITDLIHALTERIQENAGSIIEWARKVRQDLAPGITEVFLFIKGQLSSSQIQTQWVRTLVEAFAAIKGAALGVITFIHLLIGAFNELARVINYVFGTEFTGTQLAAIALLAQLTGAVGLVISAVKLVGVAFTTLKVLAVEVIGPAGALFLAMGPAGWIAFGIIAIGALVLTLTGQWGGFFKFMNEGLDGMQAAWGGFKELLESIAGLVGRVVGAVGSGPASPTMPGFSGGGQVSGSGSGDRVSARLEPGEFVVRKSAVAQVGLDFMHMLNQGAVRAFAGGGSVSINPAPLKIASGGATAKGGDRASIHLTIDGRTFHGLSAPASVADDLLSHARTSSIIRAGRAPSWKGTG